MKKLYPIFLLIAIPFFAVSQVHPPLLISPELKDYLFDKGSYWVYERSDSTDIDDSLVQTDLVHAFNPEVYIHGEFQMPEVEYFQSYYTSLTRNYQTWDQFIGYVIVNEGINWGNDGQYVFLSSYRVGDETGGCKIVATMDTMQLNGIQFYHVTKTFIAHNYLDNNNPAIFYYAKGVGAIRKEYYSGDIYDLQSAWNLKNWNVNIITYGIKENIEKDVLAAFPNPVMDIVHLSLPVKDLPGIIRIYDQMGVIVYQNEVREREADINMSDLKSGIYIAVLENDHSRLSLRLIKK